LTPSHPIRPRERRK